jgi:hypothetical protein
MYIDGDMKKPPVKREFTEIIYLDIHQMFISHLTCGVFYVVELNLGYLNRYTKKDDN